MSNHDHIFTPSKCLSKQQLIQYLQNTLEQEEVYLVESHLNDCALCSDAIDGLMENPEINSNTAIEEIQKAIETKIIAQHPVTQINKLKGIKGAIETSATNKPETLHFFSKYKWQVAASILLFMGLGGYTVFSYIKSHEQSLAKNIHETTVPLSEKQTEYRPENSSSEITSIQVPPTTPESQPIKQIKALPPEKNEYKEVITEDAPPPSSAMSVAKIRPTEEVRDKDNTRSSAPIAMREKESLSNSESDYLLDNKPQEAKKIAAKKGSNVGLSNSKPATNYNSNQLNYSQDKNISNNQVESVSAFDAEASLTDYQQGMQYFNAGNFKRSIRYLEDALPEADATQREDIQYYLAQAYVKTGKNAKADKMFKLLASGSKYKAYAEEQLIKVTK